MHFHDIKQITSSFNLLFAFLCRTGVLSSQMTCDCGSNMKIQKKASELDGHVWRCTESDCRKRRSIRANSFFQNSKLSLVNWLHVLYFWSIEDSNRRIQEMTGISERVIVNMLRDIRSVCSNKITANLIAIGGPSRTVEIDESNFGHKQKYHRGRVADAPWVFGAVERESG